MSQAIQQTKTTNLADHQAKTKEKEQLVELNDQFVAYIHKVCKLEQENKSLETRLKILQEQEIYKGNTEDLIKQFESNLKRQIAELTQDKQKLGEEITKSDEEIKNTSAKFKSALQKKQQQENKFDAAKKDADEVNLHHVELKLKLEHLLRMMEFLKLGYKEEKKELQSRIHKEKVVVQVDSSRELDMDETLREVKRQYEEMAAHSREEAEQWHKWKMDKMLQKAEKHAQDVDDINKEIKEISTTIQKLSDELKSLKEIEKDLETKVIVTKDMKESSLYKEIADQESILQKENQKLVQQARKYQELMNIKLAMDMEIATYRELLEGEETRLISGTNISISKLKQSYSYSSSISSSILPPQLTPSLSTTLPVPRNQPPLQPQNPSIPPVISKPIEKAKP